MGIILDGRISETIETGPVREKFKVRYIYGDEVYRKGEDF